MKIHSAKVVPYSSVVGQGIMLLNEAGACIGILAVTSTEEPQAIAREVVEALTAPNRHAYQVGVSVGRSVHGHTSERRADIEAENSRMKLIKEADKQ